MTAWASLEAKIMAAEATNDNASDGTWMCFAIPARRCDCRMKDPRLPVFLALRDLPRSAHNPRSSSVYQEGFWFLSIFTVTVIQSRYRNKGVTPVRPPQPLEFPGPVDQLMTPMTAGAPLIAKTGPPESPVQAPNPGLSPRVAASTRRICKFPGRPVAIRLAARMVPPDLPSPRTETPVPATVNGSPKATVMTGPSVAGSTSRSGAAILSNAMSAVAR